MKSEIDEIAQLIKKFRDERDWEQFHDGKNLAISLNIESAELLENFLWRDAQDVNIDSVKEELADVFYCAFLLSEKYNLDVKQIIIEKLKKNSIKYPVKLAKGSNKKYDQL